MSSTGTSDDSVEAPGPFSVQIVTLLRRRSTAVSVVILATLAYLPALTASPGRMPSDSKLFVYLDPGRFLADAAGSFDPRWYSGWVPHQHVAYLWPTGPWFWFFETLAVPDWIAHRLWVGTLLVSAGLGVRWLARILGLPVMAALVAAIVYQLSPYVLPYVSRTSVLLLPFAGLGWIVGFAVLGTRRPDQRWRFPAAIALVVLTVGAVNATALLMIVPAPALWLVHAVWSRLTTWRRALAFAVRTAVLCAGVSLWWVAMLVVQGRYGADVLAYSESLGSVSFTSTSTEVVRGLGYWLFYVRDAFAATTTASIDHLASGRTVLVGFVLVSVCVAAIVVARWPHRRFAALLVGVGTVLAVGAHPLDDPSPLVDALVPDTESGLALALRSSTRAVPVLVLGLALAAGALAAGAGRLHRPRPAMARLVVSVGIAALAVLNLPALWQGGFVDPALERDQDPPNAWLEAAADLDGRADGYRVLQLPGAEFGAFAWGYTVDQPLPSLTERPLVTRDLLPLGSAAAMDLAFALDDRAQESSIESSSIAPVARLLGVDTVWLAGDVDVARFRLARPETIRDVVAAASPTVGSTPFGAPVEMVPSIPLIDEEALADARVGSPIAPVELFDVPDPVPTVRVKDEVVLVSGAGDGLIDAAAAGLIDGTELIVYTATADVAPESLDTATRLIVTDSNRDRAHHWRSSQDVVGFTESVADTSDLLRFEAADQRLPVFGDGPADPTTQTVSVQDGPVTARATSYGEPFAYLPEHRPVMAIDGDPATAWLVADRFPALGERIELRVGGDARPPATHVTLQQPATAPGRRAIATVRVDDGSGAPFDVALDERSFTPPGQPVELTGRGGDTISIEIVATTDPQPPIGDAIGAVGFVEIGVVVDGTPLPPTIEWIRPPHDALLGDDLDSTSATRLPLDLVFSRLRTQPTDRWRDDPEPVLRREFELLGERSFDLDATIRLDARASGSVLAELLGDGPSDRVRLVGAPGARAAAAFDGDPSTSWITPFGRPAGSTIDVRGSGRTDRLRIAQPVERAERFSTIRSIEVRDAAGAEVVPLDPDGFVTTSRPYDVATMLLTIAEIDQTTTVDRRFGETIVVPAAISDVDLGDGVAPSVASDDDLVDLGCVPLLSLDGQPVSVEIIATVGELLSGEPVSARGCDGPFVLGGAHRIAGVSAASTGLHVDRVVLRSDATADVDDVSSTDATDDAPAAERIDPTETALVETSRFERRIDVPPCPDGCWVVVGEGFNPAWTAEIVEGPTTGSLGEPILVDGNANGWWIEPTDRPTVVEVRWTAQRGLTIGFVISAIAAAIALVLVWRDRRRPDAAPTEHVEPVLVGPLRRTTTNEGRELVVVGVLTVVAGVMVAPVWGLVAGVVAGLSVLARRPLAGALAGWAIVSGVGLIVTRGVVSERPFPGAGWPISFDELHPWPLVGILLVAILVAATADSDVGQPPADDGDSLDAPQT